MIATQCSNNKKDGAAVGSAPNENILKPIEETNYDLTRHALRENDTLHKISCEEFFNLHKLCEKKLLHMHYDMTKNNDKHDYEKDKAHVKCKRGMKKYFLPVQKDSHTEISSWCYLDAKSIQRWK